MSSLTDLDWAEHLGVKLGLVFTHVEKKCTTSPHQTTVVPTVNTLQIRNNIFKAKFVLSNLMSTFFNWRF